jgi:hypothetical protein
MVTGLIADMNPLITIRYLFGGGMGHKGIAGFCVFDLVIFDPLENLSSSNLAALTSSQFGPFKEGLPFLGFPQIDVLYPLFELFKLGIIAKSRKPIEPRVRIGMAKFKMVWV